MTATQVPAGSVIGHRAIVLAPSTHAHLDVPAPSASSVHSLGIVTALQGEECAQVFRSSVGVAVVSELALRAKCATLRAET
jgi:hypothetical protein